MSNVRLTLIKRPGSISGYRMSDIAKFLGSERFKEFTRWIRGETVGIYKGEDLVYQHDFRRFVAGLDPLD